MASSTFLQIFLVFSIFLLYGSQNIISSVTADPQIAEAKPGSVQYEGEDYLEEIPLEVALANLPDDLALNKSNIVAVVRNKRQYCYYDPSYCDSYNNACQYSYCGKHPMNIDLFR